MNENQLFTNNAISLLQTSISANATFIEVQPGLGSLFPQPSLNEFFLITLEDIAAPLNREIIKISGVSNDTLMVAVDGRGYENTLARDWEANETLVDHRITAETMRQALLKQNNGGGQNGGIGVAYSPTTVASLTSEFVAEVDYTDTQRSNKFWASICQTDTGLVECFEVLSVIQGLLHLDNEQVTWTMSNRIGSKLSGSINLQLNVNSKKMLVSWANTDSTYNVVVSIVRI